MNRIIRKTGMLMIMALVMTAVMSLCAHAAGEKTSVKMEDQTAVQITMLKGDQTSLEVSAGGKIVQAPDVTFSSSKKKVASVTSNGLIKARKRGTAQITISHKGRSVSVNVAVRLSGSEGSSGAGTLTCSGGSVIKTGKEITVKLNKTARSHNWTWEFTGTAAKDARILKDRYKRTGKITFTVWPAGGTLTLVGTDPAGYTIRHSFTVKQTARWKKREQFRTDALAGITPDMTRDKIIRYFANYIADRASYVPGNYFSIIDGKNGDCVSYSVAFKYLCDAVGIETIIVKNAGSRSHYWNQVNLDGTWYNVDAQGYDTSRSRRWILSSDARHNWFASTTYKAQNGIGYPVSPAHVCSVNYGE